MKEYTFYYSPTGQRIDTINAKTLKQAKARFYRENPKYKKQKGEVYWEVQESSYPQGNPSRLLKKLRKGITGRIKLSHGRLIIKT